MTPDPTTQRFEPHAVREMAGMFDDVSGRYDLLNRVMTLGQDRAWRAAMWRGVPEGAHTVLDLCTGSGVSLPGLLRPGRRVLGVDASLGMLEAAAEHFGRPGWGPRLVCADAFRLPIRDQALDAITVAFGVRNLRPMEAALAEMARVLAPGGTLVVLEAAAPAPGPFAAPHAFWVRHVIPLAGRLSGDPTAYAYLSRSIFEFGPGDAFERCAMAAGFEIVSQRAFMLGATRLWIARRRAGRGEIPTAGAGTVQPARSERAEGGHFAHPSHDATVEWRVWGAVQLALSVTLVGALGYGLREFLKLSSALALAPWQRTGLVVLIGLGLVGFAARAAILVGRLGAPPPGR